MFSLIINRDADGNRFYIPVDGDVEVAVVAIDLDYILTVIDEKGNMVTSIYIDVDFGSTINYIRLLESDFAQESEQKANELLKDWQDYSDRITDDELRQYNLPQLSDYLSHKLKKFYKAYLKKNGYAVVEE